MCFLLSIGYRILTDIDPQKIYKRSKLRNSLIKRQTIGQIFFLQDGAQCMIVKLVKLLSAILQSVRPNGFADISAHRKTTDDASDASEKKSMRMAKYWSIVSVERSSCPRRKFVIS